MLHILEEKRGGTLFKLEKHLAFILLLGKSS